MAVTVTRAAWKHSRAKGNARLVLLALADYVAEEKVKAGEPALAWPSQQSLADMCGCSRSTVELALKSLAKLGEIQDTGERHKGKYRGTVEWEVLPGVDLFPDDLTENESPENRSGEGFSTEHLTDSRNDLTDSRRHLTDSGELADRPIGHKPVVNPVVEPVVESGSGSPSAPPDIPSPPDSDVRAKQPTRPAAQQQAEREEQERLLTELEGDLERKGSHEMTEKAIETVRGELGLPLLADRADGQMAVAA